MNEPVSPRLTFRPMDDDELDLMESLLGDPDVMAHYDRPKSGDECQGKGPATEAARAAKELARRRGIDHLIAIVAIDNAPSARVAERAGLTFWKRADYHGREHLIFRADLDASAAADRPRS